MFEPLAGWRQGLVKQTRTKRDFADCLTYLLDEKWASASKVRLVLDNLKTHPPAALSETCEAQEALRLAKKIAWHETPLHGSWFHMVEIELSVLVNQCLKRRRGDIEQLQRAITAWEQTRNAQKATIQWRLTPSDARTKLKHVYPSHDDTTSFIESQSMHHDQCGGLLSYRDLEEMMLERGLHVDHPTVYRWV